MTPSIVADPEHRILIRITVVHCAGQGPRPAEGVRLHKYGAESEEV